VLDLDLYKWHVDILDKRNRHVKYKETDRTWQLVVILQGLAIVDTIGIRIHKESLVLRIRVLSQDFMFNGFV
jgi:hypothetical protein